jgi:uncharacterized protein DUF4276
MKVGLILECGRGGPDEQVCVHLIRRIAPEIELIRTTLDNKPRLVTQCASAAARLLEDGCERVVIIWDLFPAWRQPRETPCRRRDRTEILQALAMAGMKNPPVYLVCIAEELEAWLLSDERALSAILSTPAHPVRVSRLPRPEIVRNPKVRLLKLFQQNHRGRYNDVFHAIKIVEAMPDLARIRRCPSFARFVEKVTGKPL